MIFSGSAVALITPFDEENNVNYEKLIELTKFHLENNTSAIVVCCTTSEASTLNLEERTKIIEIVKKTINGKIPLIVGTGSNDTKKAIELSKHAEKKGADALLIVTPYYNKCNQEGLYTHYKKISEATNLPIILYNVPSRTGVNLQPETVIKLSKLDNIVGIKEASSNFSNINKILKNCDSNFTVYSGNDSETLPMLALGAKGVISVFANIYPKTMQKICNNYFSGNIKAAQELHFKYLDIMNNLFIDVNPIPVKEAMNLLDFNVGNCRLPLSNLDNSKLSILKNSLIEI